MGIVKMKVTVQLVNFDEVKKFISEKAIAQTTERIKQAETVIRDFVIDLVLKRVVDGIGEGGVKWRPHGEKTMLARTVKREALGYKNILPSTPTAYLRPETIEDLKTNTKIKILDKRNFIDATVTFKSRRLNMEVSHPRTGIRVDDLQFANNPSIQMGGRVIFPRRAKALVIPLSKAEAEERLQAAFQRYMLQHRTQKTELATDSSQTGKSVFSWRDAGLREEGNAIFALRPTSIVGIARGGQRKFLYPLEEAERTQVRDLIRNLFKA